MELRTEHALAIDSNPHALRVYAQNFPHACSTLAKVESMFDGDFGDTPTSNERKLARNVGEVDFLLGGPPCQGHSDLNNHTRRTDPRNSLYLRLARCAEILKPRHVIIENVPGVVNDRARVVQRTTRALTSLGYTVESDVVRAAEIGVPQTRRRHVLVATRATNFRLATTVAAHTTLKPRTFAWACGDLADVVSESVHDSAANHASANVARIDYLFDHNLYDLPDEQRPDCHRLKRHSYGAVYGRLRLDEPVPTITRGFGSTGQGRFVHPTKRRSLTPHEAARLQFFPDRFTFDSTLRYARQIIIGNAVPSKLSYVIALGLLREDFHG
jgi:DNA (cytosine-5)-methyltransferase 1